jgi:hypothetical protein
VSFGKVRRSLSPGKSGRSQFENQEESMPSAQIHSSPGLQAQKKLARGFHCSRAAGHRLPPGFHHRFHHRHRSPAVTNHEKNGPKSTRSCRYSVHEGHHHGGEHKAHRDRKVSVGEGLELRFAVCKQPEFLERGDLGSRGVAPGVSVPGRHPVQPIIQLNIR